MPGRGLSLELPLRPSGGSALLQERREIDAVDPRQPPTSWHRGAAIDSTLFLQEAIEVGRIEAPADALEAKAYRDVGDPPYTYVT